ncbi:unnamed protein product [Vicia faba]|uniref:Uncharacterized protein n=1 Tax=Vicia faba TaxID=3906 RepID=A0AAV1B263_VICFA|nr:unnamed protein product [Vicia faba]
MSTNSKDEIIVKETETSGEVPPSSDPKEWIALEPRGISSRHLPAFPASIQKITLANLPQIFLFFSIQRAPPSISVHKSLSPSSTSSSTLILLLYDTLHRFRNQLLQTEAQRRHLRTSISHQPVLVHTPLHNTLTFVTITNLFRFHTIHHHHHSNPSPVPHTTTSILGVVVVIAANASGAWTPIGDVTTTMLWTHGHITTKKIHRRTSKASTTTTSHSETWLPSHSNAHFILTLLLLILNN